MSATLRGVAHPFHRLLDATLQHLEQLKLEGASCVPLDVTLLDALGGRSATPASRSLQRPASSPAPVSGVRAELPNAAAPAIPPAPASLGPLILPSQTGPLEAKAEPVLDRAEAMDRLRVAALACTLCPHLVQSRTHVVFGVGSVEAELMFVGEAPGSDEDRVGEPFVGRAGQLLTRIIAAMGFSRETVYIANILKCRPDVVPGASGNRAPRPQEMDTCKPHLLRQIEIIRPKAIVALGNTAVQGLLGVQATMGSMRGRWQDFQGIPVMPTFHPSYLLRSEDGANRGFGEKRKTWTDMLLVLERLGHPISDKMRSYFLKPPVA